MGHLIPITHPAFETSLFRPGPLQGEAQVSKTRPGPPTPTQSPEQLARLAWQALVAEAELTPKPGLVDRRGSGSHTDLSLDRMRRSARTIAPYFAKMAFAAAVAPMDKELRATVAAIGREAEAAMLRTTAGSNAHKGAIWLLGLLVCAASESADLQSENIARNAGYLARLPDHARPQIVSHGELVRNRYGATGARGEACANFPHVIGVGLPALTQARRTGRTERDSRLLALLQIMSHLDDTCVLYRGGTEAQELVHRGSAQVLAVGGPGTPEGNAALRDLDRELVRRQISPGGSADLLAATLFLDALQHGQNEVEKDNSLLEEANGAN
jgi:triphosphoribosyl-dephospho-CoA synthase